MIAAPVVMVVTIQVGCFGALAALALPMVVGIFIGRRTRDVSHIAAHAMLFGLAGAVPLMALLVTSVNRSDPLAGLVRFLGYVYPITAGVGLFLVAFLAGLLARPR